MNSLQTDRKIEVISPQRGPQWTFAASRYLATLAVYGGAAGGGKTFGLLLEAARHIDNPDYRGVIFRRTSPQITAGGGLWDAAGAIYPKVGGKPNVSSREWRFPSGAKIAFRHLQHESNIYDWQGAELSHIAFDELAHFTERQVFYMMSRLRTTADIRPYMRATCNPDAGSWVKGFIQWWLDPVSGYPIPERAGKLRWFYRVNDEVIWYDTRSEAQRNHPDLAVDAPPMSVTFVPAKLSDNAILCARDPSYRAKLKSLSWVERARLEDGNWNVTAAEGLFRAEWFPIPVAREHLPVRWKKKVRAWDLAATVQKDSNDPDWLVGTLMGEDFDGKLWVLDVVRERLSPLKVKKKIQATAERDGESVTVVMEQEPASAGAILAAEMKEWMGRDKDDDGNPKAKVRMVIFRPDQTTGDKVTRAYPLSAACERGKVWIAEGTWTKAFLGELVQFPSKGVHDDQVDSASMAYRRLTANTGFVAAVVS